MAGNAKVGNRVNLWTRWQALEYITSQNFERRALDLFNVVTVVPGAIGAWRTAPVKAAGGYPLNTVAEDADLTMNLLEQGLKVVYEDRSLAFTEAPIDANGLMRQRFRWSFGTLQAVWKHRAAFIRNKAMGLFALPNILIFQMFLPLVSPFIDLMFVAGIVTSSSIATTIRRRLRRPTLKSCWSTSWLPADRLRYFVGGLLPGAPPPGQQGRRLAAVPHLAAAVRLPAGLFGRAVQDGEARHRRQAV